MNKVILSLLMMISMVGCGTLKDDSADIVVSSYALQFIVEKLAPEEINVAVVDSENVSVASNAKLVMYVDKSYDDMLASLSNAIEIYPLLYSKQSSPIFWTSPKQMITASEVVYSQILNTFPEYKTELESNYVTLYEELHGIDNQFIELSRNVENKNIAIYKNTFEHLTDYGYNYIYLDDMVGTEYLKINETHNVLCDKKKECTYDSLGIDSSLGIVNLNVIKQKPSNGNYFSAQYKNIISLESNLK